MKNTSTILLSLFRVFSVILIAIVLFFVGLMIGYGFIGDGQPFGIFSDKLWQHIFEFFV